MILWQLLPIAFWLICSQIFPDVLNIIWNYDFLFRIKYTQLLGFVQFKIVNKIGNIYKANFWGNFECSSAIESTDDDNAEQLHPQSFAVTILLGI